MKQLYKEEQIKTQLLFAAAPGCCCRLGKEVGGIATSVQELIMADGVESMSLSNEKM